MNLRLIFSLPNFFWMFYSWKLNDHINKLQERAQITVYRDCKSTFYELLYKHNFLTMHYRNLQKLVIKVFKVKIGVVPVIMSSIFDMVPSSHNLRNERKMQIKKYPYNQIW